MAAAKKQPKANPLQVGATGYAGVADGVIPESRRFGGGGAPVVVALAGCHVAGVPIEEWAEGKSDYDVSNMSYAFTDEGMEQQRQAAAKRKMTHHGSGREVTDESEKWMVRHGDERLEFDDPSQAIDVRKELAEMHTPVGHSAKFISKKNFKNGRDGRGFVPVIVGGQPVMDGESILATMPKERAAARRRSFQREQNALMDQVKNVGSGEGRSTKQKRARARSEDGEAHQAAVMRHGEPIIDGI